MSGTPPHTDRPPPEEAAGPGEVGAQSVNRHSALAMAGTVAVGVANYGFSLALAWVLVRRQFAMVAAANSLLVVVGTTSTAALPWLVARELSRHGPGSAGRREAISFSLAASVGMGAVAAAVAAAVASSYAGAGVVAGVGVTTLALFVAATGIGLLQGQGRFGMLAVLAVVEVLLKVGLGTALAATGLGAGGAVAGAAAGACVLAAAALALVRAEWGGGPLRLRPRWSLWRGTAGIGGVQVAVALVTTLDVLVGSVVDGPTRALGGYQAMLVFARVPLFASTALSYVIFPRLAAGRSGREAVRHVASLYFVLCVASAAIVASIPAGVIGVVLPAGYARSLPLLLPLGVAGFGAGTVNLFSTFLQAEGRYGELIRLLLTGLCALTVIEVVVAPSVSSLAWAAAGGDVAIAAAVVVLAARRLHIRRLIRGAGTALAGLAAACTVFIAARPVFGAWLGLAVLAGALVGGWWYLSGLARPGRHWAQTEP